MLQSSQEYATNLFVLLAIHAYNRNDSTDRERTLTHFQITSWNSTYSDDFFSTETNFIQQKVPFKKNVSD
jgi:hypothetical protein